jgi:alginate O-acetyltransferase complex protein AlgI
VLFNSLSFLYFGLLAVLITQLLPLRHRNGFLLGASCVFYMSWSVPYLGLLIGTALVDYFIARRMAALPLGRARRPWLIASVVFSVGSLLFFKYTNMFLETAGLAVSLFGRPPPGWHLEILLPLGISFYTFETLSYAVDVYRGDIQPKRSFTEYLGFLMLFPKLIAGPIARAGELLPQMHQPRVVTMDALRRGLPLIALGFLKKVLLADNFAPFIEGVFADPSAHTRLECIVAVYAYSMQVYWDFSAYSEIARGVALLLGYELPVNFAQPYLATSISDFWRRWHMTLSRWLRDYLFIPLGGSRGGRLATYRNLFITMLVGGLWHGANWTFVAWGAMNGVFLVVERAWHDLRGTKPKPIEEMSFVGIWVRRIIVFNLIALTRVFFRAPTFGVAAELLATIARPSTQTLTASFALFALPVVMAAYPIVARLRPRAFTLRVAPTMLVGCAAVMLALLVFGATQAEFIYFQF